MKNIYRKFILKIFQSALMSFIILHIIPYIRFNFYYSDFRGWKYKRGYRLLEAGDIIVTKDKWKLTSYLIPGEFTHASLCLDKSPNSEFEIAEMTHTNFTKSTFYDLCREATRVRIIRCNDWDKYYIKNIIVPTCKSFKDVCYDTCFELGVKALYCSELIVQCDLEKRLIVNYEDIVGLGIPYISPTGISKAKNVKIIWDSDQEIKSKIN